MCKDVIERLVKALGGHTMKLPHPEDPANYNVNMDNYEEFLTEAFNDWLIKWGVPTEHAVYWKDAIVINVIVTIPYPAQAYEQDGKRHLDIRPEWINAGVICHEQAHNSYALLTDNEKAKFSALYAIQKDKDPLIKLLYSKNTYGLTNDIEGHAEIYRFLGQQMPAELKKYYPRLF